MFSLVSRNLINRSATKLLKFQNVSLAPSSVRHAGGGEMHEVGDWPRTQEERDRAAKKYNLIPEDYVPFEEDQAMGDYPNLKAIGAYNRDPYDDFDDMVDMRFYGEVFHRDADLYYWERIDPLQEEKGHVPTWKAFFIFMALAGSMPTLYYIFTHYRLNINHPWKQRLFHTKDQKYYEFPSSHH